VFDLKNGSSGVIQQEYYAIVEFMVECLYVNDDFEDAQEKLVNLR
jgi:hypothetical protein